MTSLNSPFWAAVTCVSLSVSGCAQLGSNHAGVEQYLAGDYHAAAATFTSNNEQSPNMPMTQYNLGMTDSALGDRNGAIRHFREAALSGQGYVPDINHEKHESGDTVAFIACKKLAELDTTDENCPRNARLGDLR